MPLETSKQMIYDAKKGGYAIGAFNVENMEMVQAVVAAAEELKAPVILQTTPGTVRYAGLPMYYSMVKAAAEAASIPVAIHLDHGDSYELAIQALKAGYTSVMIDGSHMPFEENVRLTKQVVDACRPLNVPVEAELGRIGGKEDTLDGGAGNYTDPEKAREFVQRTGVATLAVAIGTAHGIYAEEPKLDKELLSDINKVVDVPLVLHGASGLSDEDIKDCIGRGICKVNFATELRQAFSAGVKAYLTQFPDAIDPKKYNSMGRENVKKLVMNRILVCGCDGKAGKKS